MSTIISRDLIEGANNNSFFDRGNSLDRIRRLNHVRLHVLNA